MNKNIAPQVWMLLGIICYSLASLVSLYVFLIPALLRLIGVILFFIPIGKCSFRNLDPQVRRAYKFFFIWTLFIIVRGTLIGHYQLGISGLGNGLRQLIFYRFGETGFLVPIIAMLPLRLDSLHSFKSYGITFAFVSIIFAFANWDIVFSNSVDKGITNFVGLGGEEMTVRELASSFFFLTALVVFLSFQYNYINSKWRFIIPVYVILFFVMNVFGGGRGSSFMGALYILLFIFFLYKYPLGISSSVIVRREKKQSKKFVSAIVAVCILAGGVFLVERTNTFNFLFERTFEQGTIREDVGRSILMTDFIDDFNSDKLSWLIGRGVHGSYLTTLDEISIDGRRDLIEWGFMHFILKGGIPYLLIYLYLLLYAARQGIFKSRNLLCKGAGAMCALGVVGLASQHIPAFLIYYVVEWFCFSIATNRRVRLMSDTEIHRYFNPKKIAR